MPKPKPFEIATGAEFQQKYPGYFEEVVRNLPPIDSAVVPDELKHLIPYAEQWGIPDCFVRHRFCESATPEMVAAFRQALAGTHSLCEDWFYTSPVDPAEADDEQRSESVKYAHWRFGNMYVAELEAFDGKGLRGFVAWFQVYDPEGYAQWLES
jgi:hypothetical protein